jgi:predicted permease
VGAAVLGRTFFNLSRMDAGVAAEGVLTADVALPRIPVDITEFFRVMPEFTRFFTELTDRLSEQPGIVSAAATTALPLSGIWESASFRIAGAPAPEPGQGPSALYAGVSNGYFAAMGMPLLGGRPFGSLDVDRATAGMIVNEAMARRYWPAGDAIGARISSLFGREVEIVGIVGDVRHRGVDTDPEPMMYLPLGLYASPAMTLVVATSGDPEAALGVVRGTLRSLDAGVPLTEVRTMRDVLSRSLGEQRFSATLIGAFALAALALAIVGLHGVVAFGVARRVREIGLRVALGAEPRSVMRMILAEGAGLGVVGVAIGLAGALALGRALSGMVFEVSPTDPLTLAAVSLLLLAVALAACLLPARRALRVDPIAALKEE